MRNVDAVDAGAGMNRVLACHKLIHADLMIRQRIALAGGAATREVLSLADALTIIERCLFHPARAPLTPDTIAHRRHVKAMAVGA
ncbi:MAG: hypothetical protein ACRD3D_01145 [Terriglobia bacterium]